MPPPHHEPEVHPRTPMPPGYVFVPKGNVYITSHSRKQTHAAGQAVYVVIDDNSRRRRPTGIRVPQRVHSAVLASHEATQASRARAVRGRDARLGADLAAAARRAFPRLPPDELDRVLAWTLRKRGGRVGRVGGLDGEEKARLAVRAFIRHSHTAYDALLRRGVGRDVARERTLAAVDAKAEAWGWGSGSGAKLRRGDGKKKKKKKQKKKHRAGNEGGTGNGGTGVPSRERKRKRSAPESRGGRGDDPKRRKYDDGDDKRARAGAVAPARRSQRRLRPRASTGENTCSAPLIVLSSSDHSDVAASDSDSDSDGSAWLVSDDYDEDDEDDYDEDDKDDYAEP